MNRRPRNDDARDHQVRQRDRDMAGKYSYDGGDPTEFEGHDYGQEGGSGGGYAGSRYPRMGREAWISDDLRYYGDYANDTPPRFANSGFYPSDDPSHRGGYARSRTDRRPQREFYQEAGREQESRTGNAPTDHRGAGPKGYRRSDERILEDVSDLLTEDSTLDASEIEVSVRDGEVTLQGHVRSRRDKRRAEDLADMAYGAQHVQNNLRIGNAPNPDTAET